MATKFIISDLTLTGHPESVRTALIDGAGGLLTEADVEIRVGGFGADIAYGASVGAVGIIRSTTGVNGYLSTALIYYRSSNIESFFPAGSNSPGEIFESNGGTNLPSSIVTGAGDLNNETADDIEFFSPDPITVEPDLSSFSNGFIAGQLYKIMVGRNCTWWEARYCARVTGSESGIWDEVNGYGLIDVDSAIAYAGAIDPEPYITLSAIGVLAYVRTVSQVTLTIPVVTNVEQYVFESNVGAGWVVIGTVTTNQLTTHINADESTQFRCKAQNSAGVTDYSNTVTTELVTPIPESSWTVTRPVRNRHIAKGSNYRRGLWRL